MKYTDLSINLGFHKNMQETNWLKLFPKWWAENDPLIDAIGKEVTQIKADSIFSLLNTTLKPPVMIWQESIHHKDYLESFTINKDKQQEEENKRQEQEMANYQQMHDYQSRMMGNMSQGMPSMPSF